MQSTCGNWDAGASVRKGHFFSQVPPRRELKLIMPFAGVPLPTTLYICHCGNQSLPPFSQFPHPPLLFFFFFWPHCTAYEIFVPRLGIDPRPQQWKQRILTSGLPGNTPLSSVTLLHCNPRILLIPSDFSILCPHLWNELSSYILFKLPS